MLDLTMLPGCTRCPLSQTRQHVVTGQGPRSAKYMIVGEAPGATEDETGLPFQGMAGRILDEALNNINVSRDEVYITNSVKCRPPKNRKPGKQETHTCFDWLDLEIHTLPELETIVVLGATAVHTVTDLKLSEARARDDITYLAVDRVLNVTACYHPAACLHDPSKRVAFFNDIARAFGKDQGKGRVVEKDITWEDTYSERLVAIDTETTFQGEIVGVSVATQAGSVWEDFDSYGTPFIPPATHIYHNAKFDIEVLHRHHLLGMCLEREVFHDTMVMAYLLRRPKLGLKELGESELGRRVTRLEDLTGGKLDPSQVDRQLLATYCRQDTRLTWDLYHKLAPELYAIPELAWVYENVDLPLIPTLIDMERTGITVDVDYLTELGVEFDAELVSIREALAFVSGNPDFNPASNDQVAALLFDKLCMRVHHQTPGGSRSVDDDTLTALKRGSTHVALDLLDRFREISKLNSTYVRGLLKSAGAGDGRVHTRYNNCRVESGRLSSSDPNLQNIPARTELGRRVRRAFIPRVDERTGRRWKLVKADQSQAELRLVSCLGKDEGLLDVFRRGGDPHLDTAKLLGVDRRTGKTLQFGIVYGMSAWSLAQDLGISQSEASNILARFFEARPGIKRYIEQAQRFVIENGYARTLFGRRHYIPNIYSGVQWIQEAAFREACNMPIQGTQSDIMRMLLRRCWNRARELGLQAKLLLQVHDEMVWECPESETGELIAMLEHEAKEVTAGWMNELPIPIPLEAKVLDNWAGMK